MDNFNAQYDYLANNGTVFTFKTNLDAPRYRIIAADIAALEVLYLASYGLRSLCHLRLISPPPSHPCKYARFIHSHIFPCCLKLLHTRVHNPYILVPPCLSRGGAPSGPSRHCFNRVFVLSTRHVQFSQPVTSKSSAMHYSVSPGMILEVFPCM